MKTKTTPTDRMFKLIAAQLEIGIIDQQLRTLRTRREQLVTFVEHHTQNGAGIPNSPSQQHQISPVKRLSDKIVKTPEYRREFHPQPKRKRTMSAEARAKIGAAQRARWAALKKGGRG